MPTSVVSVNGLHNHSNSIISSEMTTVINATAEVLKPVDGEHIQFVPCSIDFTGETELEERFKKLTEKNEETGDLTGSLRGFPLEGRTISLPDNYRGNSTAPCHN